MADTQKMAQVLIGAQTYQRICGRLDELRLPALQKAYALPADTPGTTRRAHHKRPAGLWSSFQMAMSATRHSASCTLSGVSSHSHSSRDQVCRWAATKTRLIKENFEHGKDNTLGFV